MSVCSQCAADVADGSRFCSQCGAPMPGAGPAPSEAAAPDGTQWSTDVGWHPDPDNPAQERYWNGWRWTQIRIAEGVPSPVTAPAGRSRSWRMAIGIGIAIAAAGIVWPMLNRSGAQTTLVPSATTPAAPTETVCAGAHALSDQVESLLDGGPTTVQGVRSGADVLVASTAADPTVTAVARDLANAATSVADAVAAGPSGTPVAATEPALQSAVAEWDDARAQLDLYCPPAP